MVIIYMRQHEFKIEHYPYTDIDRLNPDDYMTRLTTRKEIKLIIKNLKMEKHQKSVA